MPLLLATGVYGIFVSEIESFGCMRNRPCRPLENSKCQDIFQGIEVFSGIFRYVQVFCQGVSAMRLELYEIRVPKHV